MGPKPGGLARYVVAAALARTADGGGVVAIVLLVTTSGGLGPYAGGRLRQSLLSSSADSPLRVQGERGQEHTLMGAVDANLTLAIGAWVKRERRARKWTLDKLADVSGVSRCMIVSMEQGAVNPSIATLLRLGDGLGIGFPVLVALPQASRVTVDRRHVSPILWRGEHGGEERLLVGTEQPDVVELWEWDLLPDGCHRSERYTAGTRELPHVRAERLRIGVGDESHQLEAGDAIAVPRDVAHAYAGDVLTSFSLAIMQSGVDSAPSRGTAHVARKVGPHA